MAYGGAVSNVGGVLENTLQRIVPFLGFYGDATSEGSATMISVWGYATTDSAATVETAGYFPAALLYQQLNPGDMILASMGIGGTQKAKVYVVTVSTSSTITIALLTTTAG
jgi:hypothetical protein